MEEPSGEEVVSVTGLDDIPSEKEMSKALVKRGEGSVRGVQRANRGRKGKGRHPYVGKMTCVVPRLVPVEEPLDLDVEVVSCFSSSSGTPRPRSSMASPSPSPWSGPKTDLPVPSFKNGGLNVRDLDYYKQLFRSVGGYRMVDDFLNDRWTDEMCRLISGGMSEGYDIVDKAEGSPMAGPSNSR